FRHAPSPRPPPARLRPGRAVPGDIRKRHSKGESTMNVKEAKVRRMAPLATPTGLSEDAIRDIACVLTPLPAATFALYLKPKNFPWHVSGPHFRDYHLLLDEQADQIYATTDTIAERVRKIGGTTLRWIGHIGPAAGGA